MNLPSDSNNLVMIDSQVLLFIWKKTRSSSDLLINRYLELIFIELHRKSCVLELQWISTKQMNEFGADKFSRRIYEQIYSNYSLSKKGIAFIAENYFEIDYDIYASICNHFPSSKYYSCYDFEDHNFTGQRAQYCLTHPLSGRYLLFPPVENTREALYLLSQNSSTDYSIVILIRSNYLELAQSLFRNKPNFSHVVFEHYQQNRCYHLNVKLSRFGVTCCAYGPNAPSSPPRPFSLPRSSASTPNHLKRKITSHDH